MEFLITNHTVILGALLAVSEVLALIPSVKSNSLFEIVVKTLASFLPPKD